MKNLKKIYSRSVSALLALIMILACVCSLGLATTEKTSALSPNYQGEHGIIYYFSDSQPILSASVLATNFPTYSVVYDVPYYVDDDVLQDLDNSGYFSGFSSDCIVIFEIKTFMPDATVLENIFNTITSSECQVVFVSPFVDNSNYTNAVTYTSAVYKCEQLESFSDYVYNAITDMKLRLGDDPLENAFILIDSRYVDLPQNSTSYDIDSLCADSPFLRLLLESFFDQLDMQQEYPDCSSDDYSTIFYNLVEDYNIRLFVHNGTNQFVDLSDGGVFTYDCELTMIHIDTDSTASDDNDFLTAPHIFVFGIWEPEASFYSMLMAAQQAIPEIDTEPSPVFQKYFWLIDPVVYSPNGLQIITNLDLQAWYGDIPVPSGVDVAGLLSVLNRIL